VTERQPRFSQPIAFFWLLRLNRSAMVATIIGAGLAKIIISLAMILGSM